MTGVQTCALPISAVVRLKKCGYGYGFGFSFGKGLLNGLVWVRVEIGELEDALNLGMVC